MDNLQRPDSFDPADYLRVLRRRWWIVLVAVVIGVIAAVGYLKTAPKTYTATAAVNVTATPTNGNQAAGSRTGGSQVDLDTQAQVVQSNSVATLAAKSLHTTLTPAQLSNRVSVSVPPNSQVMLIACDMPTADGSASCAQAFAHAYLTSQTTAARNSLNGTLKQLNGQLSTLQREITQLTSKIATLPSNSSSLPTDKSQLSSYNSQFNQLSRQVGTDTAALASNSAGTIITAATAPAKPSSPQTKVILPSGLVAGLLIGLIIAFLIDARDKRIRTPRDIERRMDLPVLMTVSVKQRHPQPMLVNPRSKPGQGFAELAHSTAVTLGDGSHVLMVVSASPGRGSSFASANLAMALARMQSEVTLVCADLRGNISAEMFGISRSPGLTDVLAGSASVYDVARRPADSSRLLVIPPGADTTVDLYNYPQETTKRLLSELRAHSSVVIIQAQATGSSSDTLALAELADAALVVADIGHTTRPELTETLERLERLRTPVLGAILIPELGDVPRSRPGASAAGPAREGRAGRNGQADPAGYPGQGRPDSSETRPMPLATMQPGRDGARPGAQHGDRAESGMGRDRRDLAN